jgi:hypothetical protein
MIPPDKQKELFDFTTLVTEIELNNIKRKTISVRLQLGEMTPLDISRFETADGDTQVHFQQGVRYLARLECFSAFQHCPVYVYFVNHRNQVIVRAASTCSR